MEATIVVEPAAGTGPAQQDTDQPDTALPAPSASSGIIAPILIGLGLMALAVGVIPPRSLERQQTIRAGGWRR